MLTEEKVAEVIANVVSQSTTAGIVSITPLTPDASLRRYFRVIFEEGSYIIDGLVVGSAIGVFYDSVASPEAEGGVAIDADDAYVELTKFFLSHGISVPKIFLDAREHGLVLVEDLGDINLATIILSNNSGRDRYLELALQEILAIQAIPLTVMSFACRRYFSENSYYQEMQEFSEFILLPALASADSKNESSSGSNLSGAFDKASRSLAVLLQTLEPCLVHRDFHAWNLMVSDGRVRVIDFQDALVANRYYDLVSLLNDRDMDSGIGRSLYFQLIERFAASQSQMFSTDYPKFIREYLRVLLQRDLKVAGRFAKLSKLRGLVQYEAWIPGTLRRIGGTLLQLSAIDSDCAWANQLLPELGCLLPEIKLGADEAWLLKQK